MVEDLVTSLLRRAFGDTEHHYTKGIGLWPFHEQTQSTGKDITFEIHEDALYTSDV